MAELIPLPLNRLAARMVREVRDHDAVFDLPLSKCYLGSPDHDLGVTFHTQHASSPLGPAAGPHSQMAQNIVLSWIAGCRIIELKTVQVLDELEIGRPCIDMRTIGYNIEWSQELKLRESAEEYVKGAVLVRMLRAILGDRIDPAFTDTVYDMSVGYDLAGIQSPTVRAFIESMLDASPIIDRLRPLLPSEFRDLDFEPNLSRTLTLSTFHGCPPDEIERILEHLMDEYAIDVIVKLNPTLLGFDTVHTLLGEAMGYDSIRVPRRAFENDTTWDQACAFVERLGTRAGSLGLGFGIKLTNTLVVEHDGVFLPDSEKEKYLSGQPLHVLSMQLVRQFRDRFGPELPISFSAGIDSTNFTDAVALGLTPITVCSDLLRTGGYARLTKYYRSLLKAMDEKQCASIEKFILARAGAPNRDAAVIQNTERYASALTGDPRYHAHKNAKSPPKTGTSLELFNCITCDKCIPVCPNNAIFTIPMPMDPIPIVRCKREGGRWICRTEGEVPISKKHQIATLADFCNECGNCDVFCPEDGGPFIVKPRFFASREGFEAFPDHDGFCFPGDEARRVILARLDKRSFRLELANGSVRFNSGDLTVEFDPQSPLESVRADAPENTEIDLTPALVMHRVHQWTLAEDRINYLNA